MTETRLLRIKVWTAGDVLYAEEYFNSGGLPARVRIGPYTFAGRAEIHAVGGLLISTGFESDQVVRFDEDDAGVWSAWTAGWYS